MLDLTVKIRKCGLQLWVWWRCSLLPLGGVCVGVGRLSPHGESPLPGLHGIISPEREERGLWLFVCSKLAI